MFARIGIGLGATALFGVALAVLPRAAATTGPDPLAYARAVGGRVENLEATVPPVCYTRTGADANPCWTCHTIGLAPNALADFELQRTYAFSDFARTNRWTNAFVDRRDAATAIDDATILAYVREDNWAPLRRALAGRSDWRGVHLDLDPAAGFDAEGFANDGTGWRAVRYVPFPGGFWPTNGTVGDLYVRLPEPFRRDAAGLPSRAVYRANLALLEAAVTRPLGADGTDVAEARTVEALDEELVGFDLDGDGTVGGLVTSVRRLPQRYAGSAADVSLRARVYPAGTEFLHPVRYLDPDAPSFAAVRLKELRYAKKVADLDDWAIARAYEREAEEKAEGQLPSFPGSSELGLRSPFGWQLQGFIEDAAGALRLQTREEHLACMGCHAGVGVTIDQTFAFPRKVPGADGFRLQDLRGLADRPERGHADGEVLTYFRRAGGGDDLRANDELRDRFFPGGVLDAAALRRAAPGGDRDLWDVLRPSRARALALAKAYRVLVAEQSFTKGRDALLAPAANVHRRFDPGREEETAAREVHHDGTLLLDWR